MRSVVIVQTARTPMGKACRGAFNALPLAAHAVRGALARAMASHMVRRKGGEIALAGGVESISLVQNSHWNAHEYRAAWMPTRHGISRAAQDAYALQSQPRTAAAQRGALFADEIIPIETQKVETHKNVTDKQSGISDTIPVRLTGDECNRPETSLDGLAALPMMSQDEARRRDLRPLARCGAFAWRGARPKRSASVRSRRSRAGLRPDAIDLWEINEAFAGHLLLEGHRPKPRWGVVSMCVGSGQGAAGLFEIY